MREELLRRPDAVGDRVLVNAQAPRSARRTHVLLEVDTKCGAEANGLVIVSEQLSQLGSDELSGLSHVCTGQSGERHRVILGHGPGALLRQLRDSAGVKRFAMAAGEARDADPGLAERCEHGWKRLNVHVRVLEIDDVILATCADPSG